MIYVKLFWAFFQIGMFSIGGGYAAMPLIQQQVVDINGWLTMSEFTDVITISQMTPGPIAINSASFVGIRIAGILGAIVATAGCVFPSCVIVLCLAKLYYKYRSLSLMKGIMGGLRPAVVAMIASAGLSILVMSLWQGRGVSLDFGDVDKIALCIFIAALAVLRMWKPNQIYVMLLSGILGGIVYYVVQRI